MPRNKLVSITKLARKIVGLLARVSSSNAKFNVITILKETEKKLNKLTL